MTDDCSEICQILKSRLMDGRIIETSSNGFEFVLIM